MKDLLRLVLLFLFILDALHLGNVEVGHARKYFIRENALKLCLELHVKRSFGIPFHFLFNLFIYTFS